MPEHGLSATVRVPATSANLGPGFDAVALALSLYDEVSATTRESGVTGSSGVPELSVEVVGEGAASLPRDGSHLVVRALRRTLHDLDAEVPGLHLVCRNQIPQARGLGSSAAAIVAGVLLAYALTGRRPDPLRCLDLATQIEGHPDNVAACLWGGLTIAWSADGQSGATALQVRDDIAPVVFVPEHSSCTEQARGLLPRRVAHRDAARNAGRAALLVAGMTQAPDVLFPATYDVLHQPYRRRLMPESFALLDGLRDRRVAAVISGAGPSVLALTSRASPPSLDDLLWPGWSRLDLAVASAGASLS